MQLRRMPLALSLRAALALLLLAGVETASAITPPPPVVLNSYAATDADADHSAAVATDGAGNWVAVWNSGENLGGTIDTDGDILYTTFALRSVDSTADDGDFGTADGTCDTDDSAGDGRCMLRAALEQANANPNLDNIEFDIDAATDAGCDAGTGICTIRPASALPTITQPVIIDGYTQDGASANTNPLGSGSNAVLKIEIDGTNAGGSTDGLEIAAGRSTIKGLVINRFGGDGIEMGTTGGNTVEGCFIGADVDGLLDRGNGQQGVHIYGVEGNTIGGSTPAGP